MEAKMMLKLLIDTKRQRVLFAEADQKAVDFLSHILTLPMPTVINLVDDEPKSFGCISNLCRSNIEEHYRILHNPKTPVGFTCSNDGHRYFSDDPNAASVCPGCRKPMSVKMTYIAPSRAEGLRMYMVMDNLVVMPILSTVSAFATLSNFNIKADFAALEEKVVDLGLYEALELLKTSLTISNKVLTTVFLKNARKENLKARVAGLWSNDGNTQLDSTIRIKNLLSTNERNHFQIQKVIEYGVVPRLVEFLARDDFPQLQSEAAWILATIVCGTGDDSKAVIDNGAVPRLVKLLSSPSDNVREHAVSALRNIAVDCRDLVLSHALAPSLAWLNDGHAGLRNAAALLSKICSGGLESHQLRLALPVLKKLVMNSSDEKVLCEACFTLSCLCDGTDDKIQAIIDSGVCPRLIQLLQHPSKVLLYALSTIGNIVSGSDIQAQCILNDSLALSHIWNLLKGEYTEDIKRDACRTIANVTAGNRDQISDKIQAEHGKQQNSINGGRS